LEHVAYRAEGWGVGELWIEDGHVVWHELPKSSDQVATRPGRSRWVTDLLLAYFAGEPVSLDEVPVDLEYETPFLERCALALRAIPRGEVVTYGELAALAGAPGAARAAGTFCAHNKLSIFIPCHRVVAVGGLGGYGSLGSEYKQRLLALEHVSL
jgi:methylated-DNA-[protein]-cysteine S-methyltransferase